MRNLEGDTNTEAHAKWSSAPCHHCHINVFVWVKDSKRMEGELAREEISLEMPVHARLVFLGLPGWSAAIPMGPWGTGLGLLLKWFDPYYCK